MKYIPPTKAIIKQFIYVRKFSTDQHLSLSLSASLSAITLLPANQKGMS
jgi:hypothetical protein